MMHATWPKRGDTAKHAVFAEALSGLVDSHPYVPNPNWPEKKKRRQEARVSNLRRSVLRAAQVSVNYGPFEALRQQSPVSKVEAMNYKIMTSLYGPAWERSARHLADMLHVPADEVIALIALIYL